MSANLDSVIAEVATVLAAVPAFADAAKRHTGPNISRVTPPAVLVEPANDQTLNLTYGPAGMDLYLLDITVVVSLLGPNSSWAELAPFLSKTGPSSIYALVEDHDYVSCSHVHVPSYEIVVTTFAGNQYLGAQFRAEAGG